MKFKITVLIPIHNGLKYTKICLPVLMEAISEVKHHENTISVIVIDDGSSDGSAEWIKMQYPLIHILEGDGTLWWSGCIQMGMEHAIIKLNADYVLWWNNDILPDNDYFVNLDKAIENEDNDILWGSKIYYHSKPNTIWAYGGRFHPFWGYSFFYGHQQIDGDQYKDPVFADWLPGMGTLLSREMIHECGSLNLTEFPQYHGDVDYTCRIRKLGFAVQVNPSLKIWNHTENSSLVNDTTLKGLSRSLTDIKSIHNIRKELQLYLKHGTTPMVYLIILKKYIGYFLKFISARVQRWI